ncbi:MAG TPA: hypothetical protein PKN27_08365 [Propionibacteriaceae bacterium]|nr:hypothetical protein [Propionibacteriaceae bacterium]
MSALLLPLERTTARTAAPASRLRALPRPRARVGRLPFILVLVTTLGLGLVGVLVLNTTIQARASELRTMQRQATSLSHEEAALTTQVQLLRSTTTLEQRAYELGLRPNPAPAFIQLPEGTILGTPTRVTGDEMPAQRFRTPEQVAEAQTKARAAFFEKEAKAKAERERIAAEKAKAAADKAKAEKAKADKAKAAKADKAKQASTKPTTATTGTNP